MYMKFQSNRTTRSWDINEEITSLRNCLFRDIRIYTYILTFLKNNTVNFWFYYTAILSYKITLHASNINPVLCFFIVKLNENQFRHYLSKNEGALLHLLIFIRRDISDIWIVYWQIGIKTRNTYICHSFCFLNDLILKTRERKSHSILLLLKFLGKTDTTSLYL